MTPPSVVWFRRDLRVHDHRALTAASVGPVACVYVLDERLLDGRFASERRNLRLGSAIAALAASLRERGGRLTVIRGDPAVVVPAFAGAAGATDVHVSRDYAPYGRARDAGVAAALAAGGRAFVEHEGVLVHEPLARPYRVYSAFQRAWAQLPIGPALDGPSRLVDATPAGFDDPVLLPIGLGPPDGTQTWEQVEAFVTTQLGTYASGRDIPGVGGTSRLSATLRFGQVSPRAVVARARREGGGEQFIKELAWRDFFAHVLWHWPEARMREFEAQYRGFPWRNDPAGLASWKAGKTGYPFVDAGMRELASTGFMHNRVRMIAASFLTKHLLIDWREGEAHFMRYLEDGDVASNNGNWQWAASTGTDAQPYFRIFNPVAQGERFDPDGRYVRNWIPELAAVPDAFVHRPWQLPMDRQAVAGCVVGRDYPAPIVDHSEARERAFAAFRRQRAVHVLD